MQLLFLVRICSHYRRKARRRLKSFTHSISTSASVTERNEDKKTSELQTVKSRRGRDGHVTVGDSHMTTGARSATLQTTSRQRDAALDRGDPGTRRTSWQRVRPLPIPRLPPPPPLPLPSHDDSPLTAVSPPGAEVPLLSQLSLRVSSGHGGTTASQRPPTDADCLPDSDFRQQRRLTTSGGGNSPYYFKLDPALTSRRSEHGHQRYYSHNPCFMCESEIR